MNKLTYLITLPILLLGDGLYDRHIQVKKTNGLSVKGTWQNIDDPSSRIVFADTLSYWYDGKDLIFMERYWLLKDCHTSQSVSYANAVYIKFFNKQSDLTECNELIANTTSYLGWMRDTGQRHSFKRVKKQPGAVSR